jgi:hypothetical protein
MMLMDTALANMVNDKIVEPRDAYKRAIRKELFEPMLQADEVQGL